MDAPKIYDAKVEDLEQGVTLTFALDEGLDPSEDLGLWVRAKIVESDYYQPLDLNILSGGVTASAIIEPGKVHDGPMVSVEWYFETYPDREKGEVLKMALGFERDWFGLSPFEHELRGDFERAGVEMQAQEAARYIIVPEEAMVTEPTAALSTETGLWMVTHGSDNVGIAPSQPTEGQAWREAWFPKVLERSREIRAENGWDDDQNH